MSKNLVKKFNAKTPNDKTPIRRANNDVSNKTAHKTPQTLATSRVQKNAVKSTLCSTPALSSTRASNDKNLKPKLSVYDKAKIKPE